jgi:hypothetical protein
MKPLILVGCERSQKICIAFRKKGYEAYSNDIEPCYGNHPEWHLQMDIFEAIKLKKWDLGIFHPPCDFLTVSGNRWFFETGKVKKRTIVGKEREKEREKAIKFFIKLWNCNIPHLAIENPVGIMSTVFKLPTQIIQPYEFGHPETKATCLWLKNLPKLKGTNNVFFEMQKLPEKEKHRIHYIGGNHKKERSETYEGIAEAISIQWGEAIKNNYKDQKKLF